MKQKMYSQQSNSMLHDHIIDGFHSTHQGLQQLKDDGIIAEQEYVELLEKNIKRLVERIREFRIVEKMICMFFAVLFSYMQIAGDDLDMRKSGRTRTSSSRSVRGKRRAE